MGNLNDANLCHEHWQMKKDRWPSAEPGQRWEVRAHATIGSEDERGLQQDHGMGGWRPTRGPERQSPRKSPRLQPRAELHLGGRSKTMLENPYPSDFGETCRGSRPTPGAGPRGGRAASMFASPYTERGCRDAARQWGRSSSCGRQGMDSHGSWDPDVYRQRSCSARQAPDGCSSPPQRGSSNPRRSPRQQGGDHGFGFGGESHGSRAARPPGSRSGLDTAYGAGPQDEPGSFTPGKLGHSAHRGRSGSYGPPSPGTPLMSARRLSEEGGAGTPPARRSPPRQDQQSPPRIEDTTIGKGFGAFLKRGVAEAKPREQSERAEMVPSKDGGFITTIQRGFEGIFGHLASSKEEVLRKRGPVPAPEYEAVPGDDIDQRVQYYARQLPHHLGNCLQVFRTARGQYDIGSDKCRLVWQSRVDRPNPQNPNGQIVKEVFVFIESDHDDGQGGAQHDSSDIPSEPLPFYLRHSANVAYDLQCGSAMSKVPEGSRLSFAEEQGTLLVNSDADAKYAAMNVATEQAKLREQAALEWRKQQSAGDNAGGQGATRGRSSDFDEDERAEKPLPKPPPPPPPGNKQDAENRPPQQEQRTGPKPGSPCPEGVEHAAGWPRSTQSLQLPEPPPVVVPPPGNPLGLPPPQLSVPPLTFRPPAWNLQGAPVLQPPYVLMGGAQVPQQPVAQQPAAVLLQR